MTNWDRVEAMENRDGWESMEEEKTMEEEIERIAKEKEQAQREEIAQERRERDTPKLGHPFPRFSVEKEAWEPLHWWQTSFAVLVMAGIAIGLSFIW